MERSYWPTTQWQAADPTDLGMDPVKLLKLDPMIQSGYSNVNGMIVVRNGYVAFEKYYNGYGPDDPHHVASVTKSIISALIGIAIDKGHIKSGDQKVLDFFPDYISHTADRQKKEITIRHLLTMTVPYPFEDWHEPLDKLCKQPDWVAYTIDRMGQKGKLGAFKYATAGAHLLSAIITRSTGKSAREFANEHLFSPIGMKKIPDYKMKSFGFDDLFGKNVKGWVADPTGNSTGGWGVTLTLRDMARLGFLYLNHGFWEHNQIISGAWTLESTSMNPNKYGYLWWLHEEDGVFAYLAMGDGGNVICCIPEKDLVVAIASTIIMHPRDRWPLIKECIIPAFIT
ncbi:beta-lactamase family protein [Brevibacillus humidisoli]|uniref:serine hydrolase domain-containing protein n=1 Tax=Brevibacillus humidisoli TaxID=2895522 RepID=UPI001E43E7A6|nr:serine hydrolase [Brevibacillus humidisoli]UFJ41238.1 beta-lactamase family protein [Brevibacillus humidisoli]